ncbi:HlyD family efflux transporter periplasmic adaptor subunit [Tissierella creatinini]|nr:HlyD family efflux transporter periplasmic adaptor subunit [Tissierella creatinini]TJX66117.1 HlyD family efflux transporter periplasmic adaptor subunit [Soehngenia saccharolytica]
MLKKVSKKKFIIIGISILVVGLTIFNALKPKEGNYTEEVAKTQDIVTYYSFEGNVDSNDSQNVVSKTNLSIKTFHVKEGDLVNVGDLLFELDDSNIASSIEQAKASVELARINLEMARGSSKDQQLTQAQLNLNTSKLNVDQAKGPTMEQQVIQTTNALQSAQAAFDSANLNLERVQGLYQIGGAALVEVEQAKSTFDSAKMQLDAAQNSFDNLEININQNISLANEQYESARKSYNSLSESLNQNIRISQEQLNQAQAQYDSLLKQAKDMRVLAEASGEVSEIYVLENESLIMGSPIMDIVNYDELVVKLRVDEYDLAAVTLNKDTEVTISSLDKKVRGKVTDISKQARVENGVSYFEATISLEKNESLRVGLSTEVKILNEKAEDATTISMKAIQFDNENLPYVYYRDNKGKVATKPVKVGINDGTKVQVIEGIVAGETVLVPAVEGWDVMMGPPREVD